MTAAPVTLLFTDLVESTALFQRVGDERAQRVLHAHRQVLREAITSHGGREVKWLGDGLLTTFASVADGVRCAGTMAQRARRPVGGERPGLRLGLDVGEVEADEDAYGGRAVAPSRRSCWRAAGGAGQRGGRSCARGGWPGCCVAGRGSRSRRWGRWRSRAFPSPWRATRSRISPTRGRRGCATRRSRGGRRSCGG